MKKWVYGLIWVLSNATLCSGQVSERLEYGVFAGAGIANQVFRENGKKPEGVSARPGISLRIGGTVRYPFNEVWSAQSGLEFANMRSTEKYVDDFGNYQATTSLTSLIVPLLGGYKLPFGDGRWGAHAGPALRFNLSGSYKSESNPSQKIDFSTGANRRVVPGVRFGVAYHPKITLGGKKNKPSALLASLSGYPAYYRPTSENQAPEVILNIDGEVMEYDYVSKQWYKRKDGWWRAMVRMVINFGTKPWAK